MVRSVRISFSWYTQAICALYIDVEIDQRYVHEECRLLLLFMIIIILFTLDSYFKL